MGSVVMRMVRRTSKHDYDQNKHSNKGTNEGGRCDKTSGNTKHMDTELFILGDNQFKWAYGDQKDCSLGPEECHTDRFGLIRIYI